MSNLGKWVQIHKIVLDENSRAPQVPDDTKKVPLEMWVKGKLLTEANIGDVCKVETVTKRVVEGVLCDIEPKYVHNYGEFVPELLQVTTQAKEILFGGDQ